MDLPSLNIDVLLHLMNFIEPFDRFNLVLSGILKGFEKANEGIDLQERYSEHLLLMQCKWFNHNVICAESKILVLNWGQVVMARAG